MSFSNPWFILALVAVIGLYKLELLASLLNLSALREEIPARLRSVISPEVHEKALEYARTNARMNVIQDSVLLGAFLTFWWSGGFTWIDGIIQGWNLDSLRAGLVLIGGLVVAQSLVTLPFDVYHTFGIESRFGFNRTTWGTFIMDRVKGAVLAFVIGAPLLALLLWILESVSYAAVYGWLLLTVVSVLLSFIAPRWIMPLFFRFEPLKDAELKAEIVALSSKLNFPVVDVSMVDGSRRSSKANAFFTGFGKTKRIALFDTLVKNHSKEEILAVLAHEIGHCKRGHVPRQMVLSMVASAIMFIGLHFALQDARLSLAFGVSHHTVAWSLVFFSIVYQPLSFLIGLVAKVASRKHEFEADAYAREAVGTPVPLVEALIRLSRDHLGNPTPHPFYVFLHHSHPPVLQRLEALEHGDDGASWKAAMT